MIDRYSGIISPPWVADGSALASSAALTDVSPTPNTTIPANFLVPGMILRVVAHGRFSNTGTPTLLLGVYYGGVAGTKLAATGATTTTTGATNWPWRLEAEIVIRSIGSSGTAVTTGKVQIASSLTSFGTVIPIDAAATAAVTIDTTAAKALTIGAQWGASSSSNTLTCHSALVEAL
jgi:hypothetical protein